MPSTVRTAMAMVKSPLALLGVKRITRRGGLLRVRSRDAPNGSGGRRGGDPHPPAGGPAVAGALPVQIEVADACARGPGLVGQPVGRHDPGDLELQTVGVAPVQAPVSYTHLRAHET